VAVTAHYELIISCLISLFLTGIWILRSRRLETGSKKLGNDWDVRICKKFILYTALQYSYLLMFQGSHIWSIYWIICLPSEYIQKKRYKKDSVLIYLSKTPQNDFGRPYGIHCRAQRHVLALLVWSFFGRPKENFAQHMLPYLEYEMQRLFLFISFYLDNEKCFPITATTLVLLATNVLFAMSFLVLHYYIGIYLCLPFEKYWFKIWLLSFFFK
jgi:hypothetical protein